MRPAIRLAGPADRPAVVALDAACFPKDAWSETSWADEFTRPDRRVLVADEGALAGYAVLLVPPATDDPVDLLRIAVDPAHRRTGIGRQLLTAALAAHPDRTVLLEVAAGNEAAIALYRAFGFEEISRRSNYYAGGEDAVIMRRQEKDHD
ncbi:ribosomal-protein-alanine acetyltransferase [Kribbella flavida DSM 17836]|uniref:Ribosomal-protein-alanine acetyltransferase n=1 Tax=Kribbella flavida (strain DSM 17836 / JCM 10339 / NBRC 14399) TaxID=479435 RepID=D2PSY8_KRIFD|nr:GNAT family N-acetyltransferase [Kribbella flavida]ADB35040.1 ribosomal-protein-alanine acetyltransferase [Kribbella flavida DSM 17836]